MNRGRPATGGQRRAAAVLAGRWLLAAALLMGAAGAQSVPAGGVQLSVTPPAGGARSALAVRYQLTNPGAEARAVRPGLTLPPGWRLLVPPPTETLAPGQRAAGLLLVLPPADAPAGRYPARLQVEGVAADFELEIAVRPELSAGVLEAPEQVVGEPYTVRFTLSNAGNVAQTVRLSASNSLNERHTVAPTSATLAPGANVTVQVRVGVPAEFSGTRTQYLQLHAEGDLSRAGATATTRVLPARLPLGDTDVTLPLNVSVGVTSGPGPLGLGGAGLGWRVQGAAALPNGDRLALDLNPETPLLGYQTGPLAVAVGHQGYGLTPQAAGPAAFGVRLDYGPADRPWALQGSAALRSGQLALGLGAGWHPWPGAWLAADLREQAGRLGWSAQAETQGVAQPATPGAPPLAWWQVALGGGGDADRGWQARLAADLGAPNLSASLRLDRQMGPEADAWQLAASGQWTAQPWALGLNAQLGRGPQDDPPGAEFGVSVGRDWNSWRASARYLYRTNPAGPEARHAARLALNTYAAVNTSHELILEAGGAEPGAGPRLAYAGRLDWPTGWGEFSAGVGVEQTFGAAAPQLGAHLAWSGPVGDATSLDLRLGADDLRAGPWAFEVGARHVLGGPGWRGTLSARAELRLAQGGPALAWKLGYSLPLEVPLAPRRDIGQLTGQVTDAAGRPVAGLLLRLGPQLARTDAEGRYLFAAVPLGEVYLAPDGAGLGSDQVARPAFPARIESRAGEPLTRDFQVLRAAHLGGQVQGPPGGPDPAGLLLELHGENGAVLRTFTDAAGRYTFDGLLPGTWQLQVAEGPLGLQAQRFEGYQFEVQNPAAPLTPGERAEVAVRVTLRARNITIQNGGSLTPLPLAPPKP